MVRWGIVGCGAIAARMAAVLRDEPEAVITAVAAREEARARAFAERITPPGTEPPTAYGSYEALAADREVDAVYIATIHPTHAQAIESCLRRGKGVLCEKPLTLSSDGARRLYELAAACGAPLMEAIWTRYLPAWQKARELVEEGAIGVLQGMDADFSFMAPYDPASRLYDPAKGGGCLWDVGIYCAHALFHICGREYREVRAMGRRAPSGVDGYAAVALRYPGDRIALFTCSCEQEGSRTARIWGSAGWLELPQMFAATQVRLHRHDGVEQTYEFPAVDGFSYELRAFHRLLKEGKSAPGLPEPADTIAALRLLEQALEQIDG